jgi:uncharacterized protein involved in response to NO
MAERHDEARGGVRHAAFHQGFVWAALLSALVVGFPIGAHLTSILGFGFPVGKGFVSFVQTHGHVQLVGWAGLMVMGISLHFVPRLAGVPIPNAHWLTCILWLIGGGLVLRSIAHPVLPYLTEMRVFSLAVWLPAISGLLEWGGTLAYVGLLLRTMRRAQDASQRPALLAVRPYFAMMVSGWVLYTSLNLALLMHMAWRQTIVLHPAWNRFAIESFLGLVLLPVAFAFSVRMLPLYLRLPVPRWPVRSTAYAYALALAMQVLPHVPPLFQLAPPYLVAFSHLGSLLKGSVILWFVWRLDVLTRAQEAWTVQRRLHPGPERRPTRPGLPDYGEFGRFEWLVYAAYVWLVLAAVGEVGDGVSAFIERPVLIESSALRHMYLLGFISLLIFGMAVRMLPGFLHKRRVARPALVTATFWLGNAAMCSRVLVFVLPTVVLQSVPSSAVFARTALAVSGLLGWAAVWCLAMNLWQTAQHEGQKGH